MAREDVIEAMVARWDAMCEATLALAMIRAAGIDDPLVGEVEDAIDRHEHRLGVLWVKLQS